jgi:hypothetical protein
LLAFIAYKNNAFIALGIAPRLCLLFLTVVTFLNIAPRCSPALQNDSFLAVDFFKMLTDERFWEKLSALGALLSLVCFPSVTPSKVTPQVRSFHFVAALWTRK